MSIFEQILLYEHAKLPKLILEQKQFGIFNIFDVSKIAISLIKNISMLKSAQIQPNQNIGVHISQKYQKKIIYILRGQPQCAVWERQWRPEGTLTSLNGVSFLMPLGLCMPIFNKKFRAVQRGAFGRFLDLPITKSKQACHKPVNKA